MKKKMYIGNRADKDATFFVSPNMGLGSNAGVAIGEKALSGSPERDACYSFLGKVIYKEKVICPICGKEGKRSGGFSETVSTQYGDVETEGWECLNGHQWRRRIK